MIHRIEREFSSYYQARIKYSGAIWLKRLCLAENV